MAPSAIFDEYAVINGVSFAGRAAWVESYGPLLDDPPVILDNPHISGYDGTEPYPADQDQLRVTLIVNVDGSYNFTDDTVSATPRQGLIDNRHLLRASLGTHLLHTGDGTVDFVWHQPGGSTITVDVQVLGMIGWTYLSPSFARTSLDLIVPADAFDPVGS